ncbi:hypothetical protein Bhyg_02849 [Pseudolycoriella hygida]|uniref:Uncharacterized protein n=1 Tax=Pseudolycoriella hygida TaxID=35572 RepID=A0A9Q0NDS3_9DIPT|nr:hypothetical protein Bhyg_02849 [Pseudolycoriella hygida]
MSSRSKRSSTNGEETKHNIQTSGHPDKRRVPTRGAGDEGRPEKHHSLKVTNPLANISNTIELLIG